MNEITTYAMICTCGHERDEHRNGRGYCHRCPGDGGPRDCRLFTDARGGGR